MKKIRKEKLNISKKMVHILIPFGMVSMVLPIAAVVSCGSGSGASTSTPTPETPENIPDNTPKPSEVVDVLPVEIAKEKVYDTEHVPLKYLLYLAYDYSITSGKIVNINWRDRTWGNVDIGVFTRPKMDTLDTVVGSLLGGEFVEGGASNPGKYFDGDETPINDIGFAAKIIKTFNDAEFKMPTEAEFEASNTTPDGDGPIEMAIGALKNYGPNILSKSADNLNIIKLEVVAYDGTKFYLIDDKTDISSLLKTGEKFTFNSLNTSANTMKPLDFTIRMTVA